MNQVTLTLSEAGLRHIVATYVDAVLKSYCLYELTATGAPRNRRKMDIHASQQEADSLARVLETLSNHKYPHHMMRRLVWETNGMTSEEFFHPFKADIENAIVVRFAWSKSLSEAVYDHLFGDNQ